MMRYLNKNIIKKINSKKYKKVVDIKFEII